MLNNEISHKYDDILSLPHPNSTNHPRMARGDRAAQFSSFAALTGHEEAISETARLTDEKAALGEDAMERLDWIFTKIKAKMSENPEVTITYFLPDEKKAGGRYESHAGVVKKMDEYKCELVFNDHTVIPMQQIVNIEADWLERSSNEDITCD